MANPKGEVIVTYKERLWSWDFLAKESFHVHNKSVELSGQTFWVRVRPQWFSYYNVFEARKCNV